MAYAFEWNGTDYYLEYDRASIVRAEEMLGLTLQDVQQVGISIQQKLFHAALLKHHPNIKPSTVETLFELQEDKKQLYTDLIEMYVEAINTLMDENPEGNGITRRKI